MAKASTVKITTAPGIDPVGPEIMERAILDLVAGMKRLESTRLKYETVVTLLHANSGVAKASIRLILNNLTDLEAIFLKPAKAGK